MMLRMALPMMLAGPAAPSTSKPAAHLHDQGAGAGGEDLQICAGGPVPQCPGIGKGGSAAWCERLQDVGGSGGTKTGLIWQ